MLIILCGPPGCGKSTVGKKLSEKLETPFIDTDEMVEKRFGGKLTCGEIYLREGEKNFREIENEIIQSIDTKKAVVALGGGIREVNFLDSSCKVIYLKTDLELLWERIQKRTLLPAYLIGPDKKKEFFKMVTARLSLYVTMADIIVDNTFLTTGDLAEYIVNLEDIKNGC